MIIAESDLDVEYTLAQAAIGAGAAPLDVIRVLQDEWGAPPALPLARSAFTKAAGDDEDRPTLPGDHGIPEIARSERAFYDALTEGQQAAYRAVAAMVETLHARGKGWEGFDPWSIDEPIDEWKRNAFNALATKPMQAYMVGQMLTQEALGAGIARPLFPTDRKAIEFLEHQTFNEIGATFDRFKADLRTTLIAGMQTGTNPLDMARTLARTFDDYKTDFALLTITENTRAEAQGRLNELSDAEEEFCIGSSAHDAKTCDDCKRLLDGKKLRVADVMNASNYGRKKADWVACIPLHPRCRCVFLPFTEEVADIVRDRSRDVPPARKPPARSKLIRPTKTSAPPAKVTLADGSAISVIPSLSASPWHTIEDRLANAKKLSRDEREQIETVLSNRYGSGDMSDDDYRRISRALRAHA